MVCIIVADRDRERKRVKERERERKTYGENASLHFCLTVCLFCGCRSNALFLSVLSVMHANTDATASESGDIVGGCVEVCFPKYWWTLSREVSESLLRQYRQGEEGSYSSNGRAYTINFETMVQTNVATRRMRKVRFARAKEGTNGSSIETCNKCFENPTKQVRHVVILEVAYGYNMWWPLSLKMSSKLFAQFQEGLTGECFWNSRRYTINFKTMLQTNETTGSERLVRFVKLL